MVVFRAAHPARLRPAEIAGIAQGQSAVIRMARRAGSFARDRHAADGSPLQDRALRLEGQRAAAGRRAEQVSRRRLLLRLLQFRILFRDDSPPCVFPDSISPPSRKSPPTRKSPATA